MLEREEGEGGEGGEEERHGPLGLLNSAAGPMPSALPWLPLPASELTVAEATSTTRIFWL
jgi:hypothetical protein